VTKNSATDREARWQARC